MDNDVLCRGKLINYVVFGEVIVILVGDVFLNLVVEVCMDWILCYGCEKNLVKVVKYFFWVFGVEGMIGGQVIDIINFGQDIKSEEFLFEMYLKKILRLIQVLCVCGVFVVGVEDDVVYDMEEFGKNFGFVF